MTTIRLLPLGPHQYDAIITEGIDTTHHKVTVPEPVLDELIPLADEGDEERLVDAALSFLLERYPADQLPGELDLAEVRYSEPEFHREVSTMLA